MDKADKAANYKELKALALELGFDLFGVADVTGMRGEFLLEPETCDRFGLAISLGKRLSDAVLDDIRDHPTQIYFHHYRQTNFFLDRGALLVADHIQKRGFRSMAIAAIGGAAPAASSGIRRACSIGAPGPPLPLPPKYP